MTEGRFGRGGGFQPLLHVGIADAVEQQAGRADLCQILPLAAYAAVGGDVVIELGACLGIARRRLGRSTQPRQGAIARWSLGSELGEGRLGLSMLVLLGQLGSLLEGGAGLGSLLGLQILVTAPATYGGDDQ